MERFILAAGCAVRISDVDIKPAEGGVAQKPVIVLLHGYLESLEVWSEFTTLLAPHFRVVAIDLPGHGISEVKGSVHTMEFLADTVNGALEVLGVEKCYVAGHSMGGYAALEMVRKYPEKLSGFIMLHSVPNADTPAKKEHRDREIAIVESGKKDLLASTVTKGFAADNRRRFADWIADLEEQVVLTDEEGVVALLRGMEQRADQNDMLKASKVPQLFVFGRGDEYIPVEVAQTIIDNHPQARVAWLEHSGHMGFIEEPEATADAIFDFCGMERE